MGRRGLLKTVAAGAAVTGFASSAQAATTYYVSTNGSDSNGGTSLSDAWRTPQEAVSQVSAGDTVLFEAGTYGGFSTQGKSGSSGAPITFKAMDGDERQVYFNEGSYSSGIGIYVDQSSYWVFEGLAPTNALWGLMCETSDHITIENCEVFDTGQEALHVRYDSHDVDILNSEIHDTGNRGPDYEEYGEGIYLGNGSTDGDETHDVLVKGCDLHDCTGECIDVKQYTYNITIEGNEIHDATNRIRAAMSVGINYHAGEDVNTNYVVRGNRIWNIDTATQWEDGNGMHVESSAEIYNNVIHDCQHSGILLGDQTDDAEIDVYNNTVYEGGSVGDITVDGSGTYDIRNNIGYGSGTNIASSSSLFVDAANRDLHLSSDATSAIDTGDTISLVSEDHDGVSRPQGDGYDMGAYEYSDGSGGGGGDGDVVWAMNVGGGTYTASDGTSYQADSAPSGTTSTTSTGDSIANTSDDTLYQSGRYGSSFSYSISVSDGTYDVELHFNELYHTSSGSRQFDVSVEGSEAVSNLDIYGEVGHDTALVETVSGVSVSDGSLDISFSADVDNAIVEAIRVVDASSDSDTTAPTAPATLSSPDHDSSSVDLDWDASTDDGGSGLDHYNVYVDGAKDHEVVAGTTSTTVSGLSSDTSYDFHVTAVDGAGNESSASNTVTVTTDSDTSGSDLLTNPGFEDGTTGWYGWGADIGTVSSPVRSGSSAGEASNRDNYWDGPVQDVTQALSDNGQGEYDITAFARLASGSDDGTVTVKVQDDNGSSYYNAPLETIDDSGWTKLSGTVDISWSGLSTAEFYVENENTTNDIYVDDASLSVHSSDSTAPTAPSNLSSSAHDSTSVDLDWDGSSDSGGSGLDHYNVYVDGSKDHEVAGGTTSTTVSGLSSDTSYDFHVTAVDGAGNESGDSNTVTVTTDSAATNLLSNPGFESGTTDWAMRSGNLSAVTSPVNSGTYSGEASSRGGAWDGPYQDVTTELSNDGEGTYDASAFARLGSGSDDARVTIEIQDNDGTHYHQGQLGTIDDAGWTELSDSLNVSWNGLSTALFYLETDTSTADLYVDDASLTK